jgi:Holliday junction resolvase RusA-like endonuclease
VILSFTVLGIPQPKGSTQSFGYIPKDDAGYPRTRTTNKGQIVPVIRTRTTSDNLKNTAWQREVALAAMVAISRTTPRFACLVAGPVSLSADFYMPRPKRIKAREEPHVSRPDVDKMLRSICDALTGVAWTDDAQIDTIVGRKRYAAPGEDPRAEVTVYPSGEIP